MTTPRDRLAAESLAKIHDLERRAVALQKSAAVAQECVLDAEQEHLQKFPLAPEVKARLILHVQDGGAICCADGLTALKIIVRDSLWVRVLHAWGSEHLGCRPVRSPGQDHDEAKKLRDALEGSLFAEHARGELS